MFTSQSQAKAFFIERIVAQARVDQHPLTDAEEWMLRFSESDPEFVIDPARVAQFEAELSEAQYEAKITRLLNRAYGREVEADDTVRALYLDAYTKLRQGDHYLLVMIERALGASLQSTGGGASLWRMGSSIGLFVILVMPGSLALVMAVGVAWLGFTEAGSTGEIVVSILVPLFLAGVGYYLIHMWRRERNRRRIAA